MKDTEQIVLVNVGEVETFPNIEASKEQAIKVLEEAAEVLGAWQEWDRGGQYNDIDQTELLDECADVIQAVCNMVAALGVVDFEPYIASCHERNKERGRTWDA